MSSTSKCSETDMGGLITLKGNLILQSWTHFDDCTAIVANSSIEENFLLCVVSL